MEPSFLNLRRLTALSAILLGSASLWAQGVAKGAETTAAQAAYDERLEQLTEKLDKVLQMQTESQVELDRLRAEVASLRQQLAESRGSDDTQSAVELLRKSVDEIKDNSDVLEAEVKQHDETKIESATKLPLRISGALLFTSVLNSGDADDVDVPMVAMPPQAHSPAGSLSATARQTILGLDASGKSLWGAKPSADVNVDFFEDSGANYSGGSYGAVRLRTAHAILDWPNRSLAFKYDQPLISPLEPTSWVTRAAPALAWAGNLWNWSPQLVFQESGLLAKMGMSAEIGLIDPAATRFASPSGAVLPNSAERSNQPGYEARVSRSFAAGDRSFVVGVSGYYSRQKYGYGHSLDAWAGAADWSAPLGRWFSLSGEFYRGRGIGALGGGAFKDYVTYKNYTETRGVDAAGGWAQFKATISPRFELNFAAGQDTAYASNLRTSDLVNLTSLGTYSNLARNQSGFANFVLKPKSYLLLSSEWRQITSSPIVGSSNRDNIFGLAAGYLF